MSKFLRPTLVLASICLVSAVLLALVNNVTSPVIEKYETEVVLKAMKDVAGDNDISTVTTVENDDYVEYYHRLSSEGTDVGYILGLTSKGYGGDLKLIASYSLDGSVIAAKLVSNSETPGLGKKAENAGYMDKFVGTGTEDNPVPVSKDMLNKEDAAAISGASMTFNGISRAISAGSDFIKFGMGDR